MSSTAKTQNLGLNQWEASDAPLRADFNRDNQLVDAAMGEERKRLDGLSVGLEDANHNVYQLYMQYYYNGKDIPRRATMFFDGFVNNNMKDAAATTADRLQLPSGQYYICNWDPRFYLNQGAGRDANILVGRDGGRRIDSVAQSYHTSEPFRIVSVAVTREQQLTATHQLELSLYTADNQGRPVSKQQTLTNFQVSSNENGWVRELSYVLAQPVVTASGDFTLCLSGPTMSASVSTLQYVAPYVTYNSNPATLGGLYVWSNGGSQWTEQSGSYPNTKLALILHGSPVSEPPKWVAKEVVLSRPCSRASVFLTQDAASAGRIRPRLALYEDGETPEFAETTWDPSKNILLTDGKIETCFTIERPDPKPRVQLAIQFDGIHESDRLYEYGCVLGE